MTEVGLADHSRLLRSKRTECSSIGTARKRKLRELFSIANEADAAPNLTSKDGDAVAAPLPELNFLLDSELLRGPATGELEGTYRQQSHKDALHRFLATSAASSISTSGVLGKKPPPENGVRSNGPSTLSRSDGNGDQAAGQTSKVEYSEPVGAARPGRITGIATVQQVTFGQGRPPVSQPSNSDVSTSSGPAERVVEAGLALVGPPSTLRGRNEEVEDGTGARSSLQQAQEADREDPDEQLAPKSAIVQTSPGGTTQDVMDVDSGEERTNQPGQDPLSIQVPQRNGGKLADVLSSPGSTTQTATTPAIHDASTDTSPDNEGVHYGDRDDAKSELVDTPTTQADAPVSAVASNSEAPTTGSSSCSTDSQQPPKHSVEAQLLQETEAAQAAEGSLHHASTPGPEDGVPTRERRAPSVTAPSPAQSADVSPISDGSHPALPEPPGVRHALSLVQNGIDGGNPEHPGTTPRTAPRTPSVGPQMIPQGSGGICPSVPEKAVTRMSSGAIRQKSVSELLGSRRKSNITPQSLPTPGGHDNEKAVSDAGTTSRMQTLIEKGKTKSKVKTPTIVFGPQQRQSTGQIEPRQPSESGQLFAKDYFTPLFIQNFAQNSKTIKPMDQLVNHAHKTVSGVDLQAVALDNQACRILKRVYALQQQDKWSLRQPVRCSEPHRQPSHWDVLLQEMRWMRTDFREERKWKMTVAGNLARSCAEWVSSTRERKEALQVKASIPRAKGGLLVDDPMTNGVAVDEGRDTPPTPDLVLSAHSDSPPDSDELFEGSSGATAPSTIFVMTNKDVVFGLQRSPASEKLLEQLPIYGTPLKVPGFDLSGIEGDPESRWRRPALPLSKYAEGRVHLKESCPPAKRSRFRYQEEDENADDEVHSPALDVESNAASALERENRDIALFKPEMKAVRDRLHAGHQFRPPTEHPMPSQSFYESRPASQWTYAEDDQLKALVREHSYNWSLIASIVSSRSVFSSGPERRTPWECFERWVNLEGLPNDMAKTQYFKTYQHRIEAAQRAIQEHNQRAANVGPNGPLTPAQRRRPSTSIRVERRRNQKHLAMIDAMRKLAKKREAALQKSQYNANMAASRKANEPAQRPQQATKTPREYSLMRWERDQQLAEKMAQLAQRQTEAHRRQMMAARSQGQLGTAAGASVPVPSQVAAQMATNPLAATSRASIPNQLAVPGQPRPRMPMQAPPNAIAGVPAHLGPSGLVPPMPMNGIPQAQMQAMQNQHRMQMANPQPDMQLVLQARRIQDQQRAAVQLQQQQQQQAAQQHSQQQGYPQQAQQAPQPMSQGVGGIQGSPTGMRSAVNGINQQNFMANAQAMIASFNAAGGGSMTTPPGGLNMPSVVAGSPRAPVAQPSQLPPAMVNHLREMEAQAKAKHPNITAEQARNIALSNYQQLMALQRQNAIASASGGSPQQGVVNGMTSTSPHAYAQLLRAQQQAQQAAAAQQQQQASQHQRQSSSGAASVSK